jgi:two-component system phosphate regulon response regulator OmpR
MSEMSKKILVVDDDARLRELLRQYLTGEGFSVETLASGNRLESIIDREHFDVLILDVMLPGVDGVTLCRNIRQQENSIPIIMLTALGEDHHRIEGLEQGADDYLAKPFNPRELLARINAILRRQPPKIQPAAPGPLPDGNTELSFGPYRFNLLNRTLHKNGNLVEITSGEFSLLKVLVSHPRVPLSRDKLMGLARGREHGVFDRSIDVQISRLRRLVEPDPGTPPYIQTVWGFGYVFVPVDEAVPSESGKETLTKST